MKTRISTSGPPAKRAHMDISDSAIGVIDSGGLGAGLVNDNHSSASKIHDLNGAPQLGRI